MVAGGYVRNHQWREGLRWTGKALCTSLQVAPYVAGMPIRRFQRALSLPSRRSLAGELPFVVTPYP